MVKKVNKTKTVAVRCDECEIFFAYMQKLYQTLPVPYTVCINGSPDTMQYNKKKSPTDEKEKCRMRQSPHNQRG